MNDKRVAYENYQILKKYCLGSPTLLSNERLVVQMLEHFGIKAMWDPGVKVVLYAGNLAYSVQVMTGYAGPFALVMRILVDFGVGVTEEMEVDFSVLCASEGSYVMQADKVAI